ncbi:putative DUF1642 domain-containing protein [Candidatus Magnetomoraceae bacterium gMMP-15]
MKAFELYIKDYLIDEVIKIFDEFPNNDVQLFEKTSKSKIHYLDDSHINLRSKEELSKDKLQTYHDLDELAGTWTKEESDEFLKNTHF